MISTGRIAEHHFNHKFGAVPAMSQNATGSVWDINDTIYPWNALDPATNVHITNNIADAGLQVVVEGLDGNYQLLSETITLTGVDTPGVELFTRVNRAYIINGNNINDVNIHAGAGNGTIVARISATLGQTLMAVYTIPAGYTGYLYQLTLSIGGTGDASAFLKIRDFGQDTFRVRHTFEVTGPGGPMLYDFAFPLVMTEKSDIDIRATVRSNNTRVTASFETLLVANDAEI